MKRQKVIRLRESDVPLPVVYEGKDGKIVLYELKPGGRKFGLSLQAASEWVKREFLHRR